jgi:hypothetical protein
MNRKFILTLLSTPVLFASMISMVVMTQPAQAQSTSKDDKLFCIRTPHTATLRLTCERRQKSPAVTQPANQTGAIQQPNQSDELKFTDEESDKAIALFGCDCPSCINALRQLRGLEQMPV